MKSKHLKKQTRKTKAARTRIVELRQTKPDITERRKAEEALKKTVYEWETTFNAVDDLIMLIDSEFRIVRANLATSHFLRMPLERILGKTCFGLMHGTDTPPEACPLKRAKRTKKHEEIELHIPEKDVWITASAHPILDHKGNVKSAVHIIQDITEHKCAESALRESEERFRQVVENVQEWVWEVDVNGLYTYASPIVEKILGYKSEEIVGKKHFYDLFHPEDRKELKKGAFEVFTKKQSFRGFINRNVHKNGETVWLSTSGVPILDEKGILLGYRGADANITERKRAEEALRESEEKYRTLTESSITGVFIHQDGKYVFVNDRFAKIHGYKAEELLGKEYWGLIYPDDRQMIMKIASKRLVGKEAPEHYEVRRLSKDGRTIWCEMMASRIEYRGRPAIMGNITDVMERKRAAEKIARLAKFPSEDPHPVLRISSNGLILYSNKAALPLLNAWGCRRKDQLLSGRWYQYIADALGSGGNQQAEVECGKRIFSLTFAPVADSNYVNVYALDITKRKRAEEKLLEDKRQLRSLASELSLAEERERKRIAEGLHDSIIQPLVFLDIKLDSLKKSAKQRGLIDSLDEMRTTIGELIEVTRGFTFDLSSSVVYELGIEAAIEEWLTTNVREKYAIATVFEDDGQSKPLDDDMRAFLFKAVRELLVNVVKHAGAGSVKVSVARDEDKIKICVEDDGAGFDSLKKKAGFFNSSGYGLFSIRERLHYLGGSFDIESKLGHGTRVALTAPLKCDS